MELTTRRDGRVASQPSNRAWLAPAAAVALLAAALLAGPDEDGGSATRDGAAAAGPRSDSVLLSRRPTWRIAHPGDGAALDGSTGFVDPTGTRWA